MSASRSIPALRLHMLQYTGDHEVHPHHELPILHAELELVSRAKVQYSYVLTRCLRSSFSVITGLQSVVLAAISLWS